jgi:3D (Asp-Asp-Asp) domain-containing protein
MAKTTAKIISIAAVLIVLMNPFAVHAITLADMPMVQRLMQLDAPSYAGSLPHSGDRDARYTTVRTITAYSSTPDQTDATPFYTANGTYVHDGIVAANWLKFGSRVRIPEMFGDKVFVVADRMHPRFDNRMDIWFENRSDAMQFGLRHLTVEVL